MKTRSVFIKVRNQHKCDAKLNGLYLTIFRKASTGHAATVNFQHWIGNLISRMTCSVSARILMILW